jgi:protein-tyrosine phosphatase
MSHERTESVEPADGRTIPFERWWNVRDLGGLPTREGATTRHGMLVRAASPGFATPADIDRARQLGLTTFVDLRLPGQAPDWRDASPDVTVVDVDLVASLSRPPEGTSEELLRFLLDVGRAGVARAIGVITLLALRSPPVVFHCHTGKDRTGLIAVVMLSLASVPEDVIVADYLASNPGFEQMRDALAAEAGPGFMAGAPAAFRGPVSRAGAEEALRFLEESGGAEAYLASGGLTAAEIGRSAAVLL